MEQFIKVYVMSISQVSGAVGALVGFGFGIYAASANFNPDAHQAESMTHATRVFAELLFQIGTIGLYSGSLGLIAGVAGLIGDAATCCRFVSAEETKSVKSSYFGYGSV